MKYSELGNPKREEAYFTGCLSLVLGCRGWEGRGIGNDYLMGMGFPLV